MYLLDTNACIQVLNLSSRRLVKHYVEAGPEQISLCSTVKAELLHGARKSQRATKNLALLHEFWAPLRSFPFDDLCADHYGLIRSSLEQEGTPIGPTGRSNWRDAACTPSTTASTTAAASRPWASAMKQGLKRSST